MKQWCFFMHIPSASLREVDHMGKGKAWTRSTEKSQTSTRTNSFHKSKFLFFPLTWSAHNNVMDSCLGCSPCSCKVSQNVFGRFWKFLLVNKSTNRKVKKRISKVELQMNYLDRNIFHLCRRQWTSRGVTVYCLFSKVFLTWFIPPVVSLPHG